MSEESLQIREPSRPSQNHIDMVESLFDGRKIEDISIQELEEKLIEVRKSTAEQRVERAARTREKKKVRKQSTRTIVEKLCKSSGLTFDGLRKMAKVKQLEVIFETFMSDAPLQIRKDVIEFLMLGEPEERKGE